MARLANTTTAIISGATAMTTDTLVVSAQVVDISEALSAAIHATYKFASGNTTGKTVRFFLLFSEDGTNFDNADTTLALEVATKVMLNNTTDTLVTIPIDGVTLSAKYCKVGILCNAATNTGSISSLKLSVRKAV